MKRRIIGLILGAAVFATALPLTGCGMNDRYVMTVNEGKKDDEKLAAGVYIMNQYYAANEARSKFSAEYPDVDLTADGFKFKPDDYKIEGVKYSEWVNNKALEATKKMFAVEIMFTQQGLSLTDAELSAYNAEAEKKWNTDKQYEETMEQMLAIAGGDEELANQYFQQFGGAEGGETNAEFFENAGVSKESFKFLQLNDVKRLLVFNSIYGVDGTNPVTEEEWLPIFSEQYIRYRLIEMPTSDDDGNPKTEEEIENELAVMEEQVELVKQGGSFTKALQAYYGISDEELLGEQPADSVGEDENADSDEGENADSDEGENADSDEDEDADSDEDESADSDEDEDADSDEDENTDTDEDENADSDEDENADSDEDESADSEEEDPGMLAEVEDELDKQLEQYARVSDAEGNELIEHVMAMELNEPEVFKGELANYFVMKLDVLGREDVFPTYREGIVVELKVDEFDNMLTERANADIKVNEKAVKRYKPKRFIVDDKKD